MPSILTDPYFAAAISFAVGTVFTFLARYVARRYGFVAKPKADRWHTRPTAMLGGTAIFATTISLYLSLVPHTYESMIVVAASSILFIVGLVDDLLHIKPYQKLIGQMIGASLIGPVIMFFT